MIQDTTPIIIQCVILLKAQRERLKPDKTIDKTKFAFSSKTLSRWIPLILVSKHNYCQFPGSAYNITEHNLEWTNDEVLCQSYSVSKMKVVFQ